MRAARFSVEQRAVGDHAESGERWRGGNTLMCIVVFTAAFLYRFNTLGGALGGFSDDEFGYLARARQIQGGDVPFRDFNDPGWFLTDYLAAAAQWIGGYSLRSEAVLTIGMLSLGAALTFLLARRVSGSIVAALIGVALQVVFEPRHYNYPKIVLYAIGLALVLGYVDRPSRLWLGGLGALIGVAFLFRHDHLLYLGVLAMLAIILVHRSSIRDGVRAAVGLGAVVAACVVPFLFFLAFNGGVGEYFRSTLVYVTRDADRTSFSLPRFSLDMSKPLVALTRSPPPGGDRINVRWAPISDQQRSDRESRYRLAEGAQEEATTWSYVLQDASPANIEALVSEPFAVDTHGLDRTNFQVDAQALRFESQLDAVQNATAYLYYFLLLLPAIAVAVLLRLRRTSVRARMLTSLPHLVPLLVLAAMVNVGFLSRGSTTIRIADVGVAAAVIIAWLLSALVGRDARTVIPNRALRTATRLCAVVALGLALLSANGISQWQPHLREAYFASGPAHAVTRARQVWNALGVPPGAFSRDEEQPGLLLVADYVRTCTEPADRLFVLGHHPELYYFSGRLFAGGHAWLLPLYYNGDMDQRRIVARLRSARVPIVLTEARTEYDAEYRPVFERVHAYLQDAYVEAGDLSVEGSRPLRVLVRADLEARGRDERFDLPCFTDKRPSRGSI